MTSSEESVIKSWITEQELGNFSSHWKTDRNWVDDLGLSQFERSGIFEIMRTTKTGSLNWLFFLFFNLRKIYNSSPKIYFVEKFFAFVLFSYMSGKSFSAERLTKWIHYSCFCYLWLLIPQLQPQVWLWFSGVSPRKDIRDWWNKLAYRLFLTLRFHQFYSESLCYKFCKNRVLPIHSMLWPWSSWWSWRMLQIYLKKLGSQRESQRKKFDYKVK